MTRIEENNVTESGTNPYKYIKIWKFTLGCSLHAKYNDTKKGGEAILES